MLASCKLDGSIILHLIVIYFKIQDSRFFIQELRRTCAQQKQITKYNYI